MRRCAGHGTAIDADRDGAIAAYSQVTRRRARDFPRLLRGIRPFVTSRESGPAWASRSSSASHSDLGGELAHRQPRSARRLRHPYVLALQMTETLLLIEDEPLLSAELVRHFQPRGLGGVRSGHARRGTKRLLMQDACSRWWWSRT